MINIRKIIVVLIFTIATSLFLAGCSLQEKIEEYYSNKEEGFLDIENVTQFSFNGNNYTILEDTVSNDSLGEWIGYIRKLVAIDETGKIVFQENIESTTIKELKSKFKEAAYIISFLNIYEPSTDEDYLIVEVNGKNNKAILNENVKEKDKIFDFKKMQQSISGKFTINPKNATQLLCDGKTYQVTTDKVSNNELGNLIDIIAETVTFDTKTKIPLSKEDLKKIDWYGTSSKTERENWFYSDVYEIHDTNQTERVAVNVNNHYYIAKKIG